MNRLREVFGRHRVALPVIHVESAEQALRNARVARDAGADGVFLINHGMPDERLLQIQEQIAAAFPDWWVGVNCLGLSPQEVLDLVSPGVAGVWVDNAMIREDQEAQPTAEHVLAIRRQRNWPGLYFGGVAFKYQRAVRDLAAAAKLAARYMDVVTTSGPGTGRAAAPEKIRCMKEALGEAPLAVASGITPENVGDYLPWADGFLVATGISRSFEEFEPARVKALVERVHAFSPQKDGPASQGAAASPPATKRYEYPTGNLELAVRVNQGESLPALIQEIKAKWTPGNEHLWDAYDIESLIDTDEKRRYRVNQLLYSRLTVFRALRAAGRDIRGRDPFRFVGEVPEVFGRLRREFPDALGSVGEDNPA